MIPGSGIEPLTSDLNKERLDLYKFDYSILKKLENKFKKILIFLSNQITKGYKSNQLINFLLNFYI